MNIGDLVFGLRGDGAPLKKDATKAGADAGTAGAKAFDNSFSGRIKSLKADLAKGGGITGALLGGVGIGAGVAAFGVVTKGLGMVTDAIGDSIAAASDQAEAMSKVTVVFGDQADEIKAWASTASSSMVMSKTAALEAAGTFGNLFDSLGLTTDASVEMSKSVVQLASDLGSFNNVPTEDALLAIRSGLLGEAEPMRKFGSALSAARVNAYGMAKGLDRVGGQLTEAAKVQARYALILEDTKNAQGDVALTSKGLANSSKRLDAAIADLSANLGAMLLGPAADFTSFLAGIISPAQQAPSFINDVTASIWKQVDALKAQKAAIDEVAIDEVARSWEAFGRDQLRIAQMLGPELTTMIANQRDLAESTGVTWEQFQEFIRAEQALGKTTAEIVADFAEARQAFLDMGAGGAEAGDEIVASGEAADAALTTVARTITGNIIPALEDFEAVATVTMEKVENESGKGWHWQETISTRLTDLKDQFRSDLATIDWLLAHPGGAQKTRNELVNELDRLDRRRKKALDEKNWQAFAKAEQDIKDVITQLNTLDGQQATVTLRMKKVGFLKGQEDALGESGGAPGRPGRAFGGPVTRGMPYIVGERRPELFVPDSDGTILPSVPGGRQDVYHHIDAQGAQNLRNAGFDTDRLASLLLATDSDAGARYSSPRR